MIVCPVCRSVIEEHGYCTLDEVEGVELEDQPIPTAVAAQFRIQGLMGGGDAGTLYRVEDAKTDAPGVLKLLRLSPNIQDAGRDRLLTELKRQVALGSKAHLSLPRRVGRSGDVIWVFRQFIEGETLKARLFRQGPMSTEDAIAVVAQVADALNELHRAQMVHHAVRPGHIVLRDSANGVPEAVLIEAGMAGKNERFSAFEDLGNVYYMPPEVAQGKAANFRSDIYSLGCVFFDALTGEPPFDGDDAQSVITAHRFTLPAIPEALPSAIGNVLKKMLAKVPSDRGTSTGEIVSALAPYAPEPETASSRPPRSTSQPPLSIPKPAAMAKPVAMPPAAAMPTPPAMPKPIAMPAPAASMDKMRSSNHPPALIDLVRVKSNPPPPMETQATPPRRNTPIATPLPPRQDVAASSVSRLSDPMPDDDDVAPSFASKPAPRNAPKSLKFAIADMTEVAEQAVVKRGRRFPWLAAGFVLGCLTTGGATYGLAMNGQFHVITGAMENYLQVPGENLASIDTPPPVECAPAEEAETTAAAESEEPPTDPAEADTEAEAEAEATPAQPPTRAERRAARRRIQLQRRRQARARARQAARRAARMTMAGASSSGDSLGLSL